MTASFTDDDLRRLKIMFTSGTKGRISWDRDKWLSLIARLEAAEKCVELYMNHEDMDPFEPGYIEVWRKAAGK
jgi:hypothetical protein